MRTLLALTALLLTPAALIAQASHTTVTVLDAANSQNCPVGVQAQHAPQGAVHQVNRPANHYKLGYNISLSSFDSRLIRQATITLRGLEGAQVLPASYGSSKADATERFTISPGASPKPTFESIVYTQKLTGVLWIEVNQVSYADGTEWHQAPGSVCRVPPGGYLEVNSIAR
jgi:hypothetical protein